MSRSPRARQGTEDRGPGTGSLSAASGVARDASITPTAAQSSPVAGVVGEAGATRSGDDTRRRGWFWHWNSIVTQFAPLIGLKGVGLLNSYTVWTDRRDESPHRGYAFPSQQREADFYGEDRAELIAINKLLVALDLIEIRKEMVLRVDEQGRRWRVPHNFYRVKDHGDGFTLTAGDVLRVAELADRDQAIYRHVRHIFSARFAPIDAENVWSRILVEVRETEIWRRLAARAAGEESRASARTKAGHAARKAGFGAPGDRDTTTNAGRENDTLGVISEMAAATSVAPINAGSMTTVGATNHGSPVAGPTIVDPLNAADPTSVEPSNTTYDQFRLTTTTTRLPDKTKAEETPPSTPRLRDSSTPDTIAPSGSVAPSRSLTDVHISAGPGDQPAPADAAGEAGAIRAFEDANGRPSTPAERQILRELAARFAPAAHEQARLGRESGWSWLTAAVYEAVEAGSAFVAPRRLREIMSRWEREGIESRSRGGTSREVEKSRSREGGTPDDRGRSGETEEAAQTRSSSLLDSSTSRLLDSPDFPLPHGFGSRRTWEFTVGLLASVIERATLDELVAGVAIVGYRDGEATLAVPDPERAERIAGEYRDLIARKLSEAMRRPVRVAVLTESSSRAVEQSRRRGDRERGTGDRRSDDEAGADSKLEARSSTPPSSTPRLLDSSTHDDEATAPPSFIVAECGLPSGQVWAAVLEEVTSRGAVSRANVDAWLTATALIGRGDDDGLIVGVPHALAQRRIESRFLPPLRAAVAAIVGELLPIEVVVAREWLRTGGGRDRRVGDEHAEWRETGA